jgi:phospholipid/cholesterol/gamma-HCH transport system substrate-binding protein
VKAFTERRPVAVGLVALVVMAAAVLAVLFLNRGIFRSGYQVSATFADAAGIGPGTQVLLAGVAVGTVGSVQVDGNRVDAVMTINNGVVLPRHTDADIQVETLLGVVDVMLEPVSGWSWPLRQGAVITDTSIPTEFYQLSNTAGRLLQHADARALNQLVTSLAAITQGKQRQVGEIIHGLGKLTATVDQRRGQVSQLIDAATTLSTTLADHDQQLSSVIDNLDTVAAGLSAHSADLASLIGNIDAVAGQTNSLVGQNQSKLQGLIQNLDATLGVVDQHQDDLAQAVSYLGAALRGFASVGYSGPNDTPNTWANIYNNVLGTTGAYGVLSPCGALDQALDEILGPTPLACDQQAGPLPGTAPSNLSPGPAVDGGSTATAGSAPGTAPGGGTAGSTGAGSGGSGGSGSGGSATSGGTAGPDSGIGGLSQLLSPLAGGGS